MNKDELNKIFSYSDGNLYWKITPSKGVKSGALVGSYDAREYMRFTYKGKKGYQHRAILTMHYGEIHKTMVIKHKNGDSLDNKIENLYLLWT